MKPLLIICILISLSGCVKYHTRAFQTKPKYEVKYVDKYYCYIKRFAAYEGRYCEGVFSKCDELKDDSVFNITFQIFDTSKYNLPIRWWDNIALKDSLTQSFKRGIYENFKIDSLLLYLLPQNNIKTLTLQQSTFSPYYSENFFGDILIPLDVKNIRAVIYFTNTNKKTDSLAYLLNRNEKHRWGMYIGI